MLYVVKFVIMFEHVSEMSLFHLTNSGF